MRRSEAYVTALTVVLGLCCSDPVSAQHEIPVGRTRNEGGTLPTLRRGTSVRLIMNEGALSSRPGEPANGRQLTGTLIAFHDGVLTLNPEAARRDTMRVPLVDVEALYVGNSGHGHALLGGLLGFAAGLSVALLAQSDPPECEGWFCGLEQQIEQATRGVFITLIGTAVGLSIGSGVRGEATWERVHVGAPDNALLRRPQGEYRVAACLSF